MSEILWKNISYGGGKYSVSNQGGVRNNYSGQIVPFQIQNSGYKVVCLTYKKTRKTATIHRLVAIAFIPSVVGKNYVDHKDFDRLNNNASNLRWVTNYENMQFVSLSGRLKNSGQKAAIRMVNIGRKYGFGNSQKHLVKAKETSLFIDNQVKSFISIRAAAKFLKMDHKSLGRKMANGEYFIPAPGQQTQFF